jgi:hypothetical protein
VEICENWFCSFVPIITEDTTSFFFFTEIQHISISRREKVGYEGERERESENPFPSTFSFAFVYTTDSLSLTHTETPLHLSVF